MKKLRYILDQNTVKKLCENPDLSDNGHYLGHSPECDGPVYVNILETYHGNPVTIKLRCYYPDGGIEEGWTFRDVIRPVYILNDDQLFDGRFNQ